MTENLEDVGGPQSPHQKDILTTGLAQKLGVSKQWLIHALKAAKDTPIQSRKGKLGQIKINPWNSTPNNSYATHAIRKLEQNVGGKYDVAEKLQAAGGLNTNEKHLIELIMKKSRSKSKLVSLVAEAGVDPARVIKLYAEGAVALGKAEALAVAAEGLGSIARQLVKQASIGHVACITCLGSGQVPKTVGNGPRAKTAKSEVCPSCKGQKLVEHVDKNYKFAVTKLLDMTKLGAESGVNVNTNVAVQQNVEASPSGFMEKLSKLTDGSGALAVQVLPPAAEVVDVLPEDSPSEAG